VIFTELALAGPLMVDLDQKDDHRGFFARTFCAREFQHWGLEFEMVQGNLAFSRAAGTLRGMHYQAAPAGEAKLIRCLRGSVWDVLIDMRPESETYLKHVGFELSAERRNSIYVPQMFAHGYITLMDNTELLYHVSRCYSPDFEMGVRYDDPMLGIDWPHPIFVVSDKDRSWPDLSTQIYL
jgi:dTDP-4-dehydrorhamnose 3,5-epimerase